MGHHAFALGPHRSVSFGSEFAVRHGDGAHGTRLISAAWWLVAGVPGLLQFEFRKMEAPGDAFLAGFTNGTGPRWTPWHSGQARGENQLAMGRISPVLKTNPAFADTP